MLDKSAKNRYNNDIFIGAREPLDMTYAEAIKKLRQKMMLSQTELADLLGVSFGTVNRWEAGKYTPTFKTRRKLAQYLKKYNIEIEENGYGD